MCGRTTTLILLVAAFLAACGSNENNTQERSSKSKNKQEAPERVTTEEPSTDTTAITGEALEKVSSVEDFAELYKAQFRMAQQKPTGILSRFSTERQNQYALTANFTVMMEDSSEIRPAFTLQEFQYADSSKFNNAALNLMACFGQNCEEIEWGIDTSGVDTQPVLYLFGHRSIYAIHHSCVNYNWGKLYSNFMSIFNDEKFTILKVDCQGNVIWNQ